jgi:hypothetical protein
MRREHLARPLAFLHGSFWGCVASFALAMGVPRLFPVGDPALLTNALLAVFFVCACAYWTSLGILAHRLRQSAVIWILAGLATLAIGFIATYLMMARRAHREISRAAENAAVRNGVCPHS